MYEPDLALLHHTHFREFAEHAAREVLARLSGAADFGPPHGGRIVELGCGTGITARLLGQHGYQTYGVDVSSAAIAVARAHCDTGTFAVDDIHTASLPPAQAVLAVGEVLNYRDDSTPPEPTRILERVSAVLPPGGLFLFDTLDAGPELDRTYDRIHEGSDWYLGMRSTEDRTMRRVERSITTFFRAGQDYRRFSEHHSLQLWSVDAMLAWLTAAGFVVRRQENYDALCLGPGRSVFVCVKK